MHTLHEQDTASPDFDKYEALKCTCPETAGLNWKCPHIQCQYLSNVEIQVLKLRGATIHKIYDQDAVVFEKRVRGDELFSSSNYWKLIKLE